MKVSPVKIYIPEEDIHAILEETKSILQSGWFILGDKTKRFEAEFAKESNIKYAVAVNNATSAIEIILRILNVSGKEVLVPTNTNFATIAAVINAGGIPRMLDCNPLTFSINFDVIKREVNKNTAGVLIVHIGGIINPDMKYIADYCKSNNLFLVEDCAHAHGSTLDGKWAGSFGDAGAYSFYPTKVITAGEGGMIVTNSEKIYNEALIYRDQGKENFSNNFHIRMGNSWRISEINATIGFYQLNRLKEFIITRNKIAKYYDNNLNDVDGLTLLKLPSNLVSNYYKYIAILDNKIDKNFFKKILLEKFDLGLSGGVYDIPCHLQPIFKNKFLGNDFKSAESVCKQHICLPMSAIMTTDEAEYVANSIKSTLEVILKDKK